MSDIVVPDQYVPVYQAEKQMHPEKSFVYRQFIREDVEFVDRLVELSLSRGTTIENEEDWNLVREILSYFIKRWPDEFRDFGEGIDGIRQTRNKDGYSKSKQIQYVGALPPRFERLLKICFPDMRYDKKFIWELVRRMPIFKVAGEKN